MGPMNAADGVMSAEELATATGRSSSCIYHYTTTGCLPYYKVGRNYLYPATAVDAVRRAYEASRTRLAEQGRQNRVAAVARRREEASYATSVSTNAIFPSGCEPRRGPEGTPAPVALEPRLAEWAERLARIEARQRYVEERLAHTVKQLTYLIQVQRRSLEGVPQ